ncbi:MAG: hypothetical protein K6G17_03210 [Oscillospiraceae bacterium]|nr:hypothetical protein [Oscillospiraceae bacterium]
MKKKSAGRLFLLAIFVLCVFLAASGLLLGVELTKSARRAEELQNEIAALADEKARLELEEESMISLEELEERAVGRLGLQRRRPEQIVRIELRP